MSRITLLIALFSLFLNFSGSGQTYPVDVNNYQGKIRVACIGNSVTYGHGIEDREAKSYPAQLQQMLGDRFEVKNFGHSGATLLKKGHRPYWEQEVFLQAQEYNPHLIVIHLGLNDTDPRNWALYRDDFIADYSEMIDVFRKGTANPSPKVWICKMTPIFSGHHRFKAGTRDWFWQIQETIEHVAVVNNTGFIDLHTPLYGRIDLFPDNLHPVEDGAGIIASIVYGELSGQYGGLELPEIFADHMVLQREMVIPVWGTANYQDEITVTFADKTLKTTCDEHGNWKVSFPPMAAGGPHTLQVTTKGNRKAFVDILVGEVWLCSGQSNMAFEMNRSERADEEIKKADYPEIRFYKMEAVAWAKKVKFSEEILDKVNRLKFYNSSWLVCSPETVSDFSAIAYHFGRSLHDNLGVPIGLIENSKGGSPAEAWVGRKALEFHPQLLDLLEKWESNEMIPEWCKERGSYNLSLSKNPNQRHPFQAAYLYEAGINPLKKFPIKGAVWYQGESNAEKVELHEEIFTTLIKSWREAWGYDFSFYYVQLSSLNRPSWPMFRDSQRRLLNKLDNTGMAVCSDLGNANDVHPKKKKEVGERLSLLALANDYHLNLESSGPLFKNASFVKNQAILQFKHAEGMKSSDGKALKEFEVAGFDRIFKPAVAVIEGAFIVVRSSDVAEPQYVRYGWKPFSEGNLVNRDDLPASTFSTEFEESNKYLEKND
ncbi:MAG: sialate O-acetylesterase [Bacteroidetes bacterium]|jgi:sialate O-acetylesterase|nr:sialate O-acetylesterase [Bacteroidota bacterium]MBT3749916.1 sialate O-acetylesterase [Bacteroidota bacterium]MBT4401155.1 sialate O-acetylesterase [Bacteroidota bacterium]MBT4411210.1 sialate O-acetylesterase [Bacteroidota bacterium]MBT5427377.1 sialate O-acetylesterase [Bacteroidota bacterium]